MALRTWAEAPNDDTISGHEMLDLPRGVLLRTDARAFQAECRGFETRLPLQFPLRAFGLSQWRLTVSQGRAAHTSQMACACPVRCSV